MDLKQYLTDLYYLVRVIDAGGFSAAARDLNTTRSLLSRHIIALERALGVSLLIRDARHFAVTRTGEKVYQQAVLMCDAAQAAVAHATEPDRIDQGHLRIGTGGFLSPLIARLLAAYADHYPQIQLQNQSLTDGNALVGGQADIALHLGHRLPNSTDIMAHQLARVRLVMVASPALLARLRLPRQPFNVKAKDQLVYTGHNLGSGWMLRGGSQPDSGGTRLVSEQLEPVLEAARQGMGVAQLPLPACREDLEAGHLQLLFEDFEPSPMPLHALTLTTGITARIALGFIDFARDYLARSVAPPPRFVTDSTQQSDAPVQS